MNNRTCSYRDPFNVERCTECAYGVDMCQCVSVADKAHERLTTPVGIVMRMVRGEVELLLGTSREHALPRLMDEVGQLAHLMIQNDVEKEVSAPEVLRRAVVVAAHTIALAVSGDANFLYELPVQDHRVRKLDAKLQ